MLLVTAARFSNCNQLGFLTNIGILLNLAKQCYFWNEILLFCNLLLLFVLFWVKPLQKLKICSVFWQFDFVFAVWELFLGAKTQLFCLKITHLRN